MKKIGTLALLSITLVGGATVAFLSNDESPAPCRSVAPADVDGERIAEFGRRMAEKNLNGGRPIDTGELPPCEADMGDRPPLDPNEPGALGREIQSQLQREANVQGWFTGDTGTTAPTTPSETPSAAPVAPKATKAPTVAPKASKKAQEYRVTPPVRKSSCPADRRMSDGMCRTYPGPSSGEIQWQYAQKAKKATKSQAPIGKKECESLNAYWNGSMCVAD